MKKLIKKRLAAFRHTVIENPLFRHELLRWNIYTWDNLAYLLILLGSCFCAWMRLIGYLEACRVVQALPHFLKEEYSSLLGLSLLSTEGSSMMSYPEQAYYAFQVFGLGFFYLFLLSTFLLAPHLRDKNKMLDQDSESIRLLPLSKSQVHFALVDRRFFAYSLCVCFCTLLLLIPGRINNEPSFNNPYLVAWISFVAWVLVFALYRTVQFQASNYLHNPMMVAWFIVTSLIVLIPVIILALSPTGGSLYDEEIRRTSLIVGFIIANLSCVILLLFCWTRKKALVNKRRFLENTPPISKFH